MDALTVSLQDVCSLEALMSAWKKVRANHGAAGIDHVTIDRFDACLEANLRDLSSRLRSGTYLPLPARAAVVPKRDGTGRPLAILSVEDRTAQRAALDALELQCDSFFLDCSFGYRPRRGIGDAARAVLEHGRDGRTWVVDADVEGFFGSLDRIRLCRQLQELVRDPGLLRLLGLWVRPPRVTRVEQRLGLAAGVVGHRAGAAWRGLGRRLAPWGAWLPILLPALPSAQELAGRVAEEGVQRLLAPRPDRPEHRLPLGWLGACGVAALAVAVVPAVAGTLRSRFAPRGIGQGAPLSPLLANLYLHPFDAAMTAAGYALVRYADDRVPRRHREGASMVT